MPDVRQQILLSVAILIPAVLILLRRDRLLLVWICLTVGINIFDARLAVNFPAARLTGLLLIPRTLHYLPRMARSPAGRATLIHFAYLGILAFIFGYLLPWPADSFTRRFNQLPPGRAAIYMIRTLADMSIAFFVAMWVVRKRTPAAVLKGLIVATSVAAIGGIMEVLTGVDIYGSLTGVAPLSVDYRVRGFTYEPRGLGLVAAHGFLISVVLWSRRRTWSNRGLAALHGAAILIAGSTSAAVALAFGSGGLFLLDRRTRRILLGTLLAAMIAGAVVGTRSGYLNTFIANATVRLTAERFEFDRDNLLEDVALRMDVFDGPALLLLAAEPTYLIFGTGPGLIPIPATRFLPVSPEYSWLAETGINTPPTSGLLLELSNAGLIGIALWIVLVRSSLRAFQRLSAAAPAAHWWGAARSAFAVAAALYLVQASPLSAIWAVFAGCGIGASCLVRMAPQGTSPA